MIPIKDLVDYTKKMSDVIKDKLFFVDKVNSNIFIDYGCADGTLLQHLDYIYNDPEKVYIGYDKSEEMINLANSKWGGTNKIYFTNDFNEVIKLYSKHSNARSKVALILSSVLHEILSQNILQPELWEQINKIDLNYIIIRDMAFNPLIIKAKLDAYITGNVYLLNPLQYNEFTKKYGGINDPLNICHYLLKYRYTQNWKRELDENYFAFDPDFAIDYLKKFGFVNIYLERFNVPYLVEKIKEEARVDLNKFGQTHIKMIFQK